MVDHELLRAAELSEAGCLEAMYAAASDRSREALGMTHTRFGEALVCVMAHDPTAGCWNRAVGLGVDGPLTDEVLDEVLAFARSGNAPSLLVPIAPGADPDGLLAARGLTLRDTGVKFLVPGGFTTEAETGLHLEQISPDLGKHFARVIGAALGLPEESPLSGWFAEWMRAPGMTSYAAFDGWTIAAVALLHVDGELASLHGTATLPEERGRGAQSGLVARRIDDANALGVRWIAAAAEAQVDGSSSASLHNLRRLGLTELYERQNWVWRP